ncbi:MAG: methyl-accepting chemotaxis protein [Firmicutes bacterium]|nr:methyl-accepting chemotaxis protein [Bacillota bacterium]
MRLGVGVKIIAGYVVLVVVFGAVGLFAINGINGVRKSYQEDMVNYVLEALLLIRELDAQITKRILAVTYYVETLEENHLRDAQGHEKNVSDLLAKLDKLIKTEQGKAFLKTFRTHIEDYDKLVASMIANAKAGDEAGVSADVDKGGDVEESLSKAMGEWVSFTSDLSDKIEAGAKLTTDNVQRITLIVTVLAAILGVGLGLVLGRLISRPLGALTTAATAVAAGDLTISAPAVKTRDEIEKLTVAFGGMLDSLKHLVKKTSESAEQVAASSEELSATAEEAAKAIQQVSTSIQDVTKDSTSQAEGARETSKVLGQLGNAIDQVAAGAQTQSKSLSEATRSVEGMVKAVDRIGSAAQQVALAAETARSSAQSGRQAIEKTVSGMETINKTSDDIRANINELSEHSQRIVEIVQVISDIADQTNLLALNAAIEAARAGEHGRGFAVVADEVRKLAERSSKSTKEIANLIADIQKGTEASVKSVGVGAEAVKEGFNVASEAREVLGQIVSAVENAGVEFERIREAITDIQAASKQAMTAVDSSASVVEEATAATEQMAASSSQVLGSADSIAKAAERNASAIEEVSSAAEEVNASIEEMASSAQSLAQMAQDLRKLVGTFRL